LKAHQVGQRAYWLWWYNVDKAGVQWKPRARAQGGRGGWENAGQTGGARSEKEKEGGKRRERRGKAGRKKSGSVWLEGWMARWMDGIGKAEAKAKSKWQKRGKRDVWTRRIKKGNRFGRICRGSATKRQREKQREAEAGARLTVAPLVANGRYGQFQANTAGQWTE